MAIDDKFVPDNPASRGKSFPPPQQTLSEDGAVTIAEGVVWITKGSAAAITLDTPPTNMDGASLEIVSTTAFAHTVTQSSPGFNGAGASGDIATYGAAAGNTLKLRAKGGVWYTVNLQGVTIA